MEIEEDEEVVLPNSALYTYLSDMGYQEDEILVADQRSLSAPPSISTCNINTTRTKTVPRASSTYSSGQSVIYSLFVKRIYKVLVELLEEDDLRTVDIVNDQLRRPSWLLLVGKIWSAVTFIVMSCLLLHFYFPNQITYLSFCFTLLFATASVFILLHISGRQAGIVSYSLLLWNVRNLLTDCAQLTLLLRKCVRLIQEKEIINRGFTFVNGMGVSNALHQSESTGSDRPRQCASLRKLMFLSVRSLTHHAREVTREIRGFGAFIGIDEHSLVDINDDEFGVCFTADDKDEATLVSSTDNFSLSAIKSLCQLYVLHLSELIKKLILALNPSNTTNSNLSSLSLIISHTHSIVNGYHDEIKAAYRLHAWQDVRSHEELSRLKKEKRDESTVTGALHSLELHLESALLRARELQSCINFNVSVEGGLSKLRSELKAVHVCLQETERGLASPQTEDLSTKSQNTPSPSQQSSQVVYLPLQAPVIEDEFLECYVDGSEVEEMTRFEDGGDEMANQRLFRAQVTKPVMSELRSVIREKKKEFAIREQQQRQRKGLPETLDIDTEFDGPKDLPRKTLKCASYYSNGDLDVDCDEDSQGDIEESSFQNTQTDLMSELAKAATQSRINYSLTTISFQEETFGDDSDADSTGAEG